jgi:hypothetical protein
MKKTEIADVSVKSTKDQILAAYQDVLAKLNEKQVESPQETKKKQEEKTIVAKAAAQSPDAILSDLSGIKLKSIKQLDTLSEELLSEFQKLSDIRQAIDAEQKHLEELYQIKETAHTLAALLQTHTEQKEQMKREMEQQKQTFEESMTVQRTHWKEENAQLERDLKEQKEKLELNNAHSSNKIKRLQTRYIESQKRGGIIISNILNLWNSFGRCTSVKVG